jgi:hypothetical protein
MLQRTWALRTGQTTRMGSNRLIIKCRTHLPSMDMPAEFGSPPERGRRGEGTESLPAAPDGTDRQRTARLALASLREHGGERTLIRLARDVATRRNSGRPTPAEVRAEYRRLHREGLWRLVAAGVVSYSDRDGTVRFLSES